MWKQVWWAEAQGIFLALLGLPHDSIMYFQVIGASFCKILWSPLLLCSMIPNLSQAQAFPSPDQPV